MSSVHFSQAKDAQLAWVDGEIHLAQPASSCSAPQGGDEDRASLVPVLGPAATVSGQVVWNAFLLALRISPQDKGGHTSVLVNPPRLSDFKQVLTKAGISVLSATHLYYTWQ